MIVIILRDDDAQLLSLRLETQHIPQHMANPGITATDVHPLTSCIPNGVMRSRNNCGNSYVCVNHKNVYLTWCFVYFSYLPCQDLVYTACSYPSISRCLWETFVVVFYEWIHYQGDCSPGAYQSNCLFHLLILCAFEVQLPGQSLIYNGGYIVLALSVHFSAVVNNIVIRKNGMQRSATGIYIYTQRPI